MAGTEGSTSGSTPRWRRNRVGDVLTRELRNPFTEFFNETIWDESPDWGWLRQFFYPKLRVITLVYWNYYAHGLSRHAAALTYSSVLALVPILAVSFSLFQVFGGLRAAKPALERKVFELLIPTTAEQQRHASPAHPGTLAPEQDGAPPEAPAPAPAVAPAPATVTAGASGIGTGPYEEQRRKIQQWIDEFIDKTQNSKSANAILGTLLLFFTVVNTLSWIESSFNEIFGVRRSRPLFQRFMIYWAVATLGPVFFAASIGVSASFLDSSFVASLQDEYRFVRWTYDLLPTLFVCAAFTVLYRFLPNTSVRFRAAVTGGLIAGIAFEIAKSIFASAAGSLLMSYQQVYGPIALLFVFFFWVWLNWMIALLGLEFVVAAQSATTHRREELASQVSQKVREMIALRVVTEIAERFFTGAVPPTPSWLAGSLDVPLRLVFDVLAVLDRQGIVRQVEEANEERGYLPARHIGKMTVYDVIGALREDGASGFAPRADDDSRYLARLVKEAEAANRRVFGEETLESVVVKLHDWRSSRKQEKTPEAAGVLPAAPFERRTEEPPRSGPTDGGLARTGAETESLRPGMK